MKRQESKEPEYLITEEAAAAVLEGMAALNLVDAAGRPEWTKLSLLIKNRVGRERSKQQMSNAVKNVGGRSVALRDMLIAVGKPTHLAFEMDDVDRLVLRAVHDGGIEELSQEDQRLLAEFIREQTALRVRALGKKT